MANTIKPKRSNTSGNTPSLQEGEIAISVADKKLWIGDNSPTPTPVLIVDGNADCFGIASADISNWNTAYSWGDHASASYITSESDPIFTASDAYGITATDISNWDSAYSERRQWDGGSTNLVAATGRTSLGGTTVGSNLFTLADPSAVTFLKINANNTVSAESASTFRTSIGAGTGNGTITSIATTSPITGGTITSTGTIGINASSANTASYVVQRDASGNFSAGTITATLTGTASTATNLAGGGAGQLPYQSGSGTTAMLAAGTSGQVLQSNGTSAPSWVASPSVPVGSLFQYAGSSAPSGYLLCQGQSVSSTTYLALHAVISNTYGGSAYTGGSGLNFNLPDLRGRFPMGAGTGTGLNSSGTGAPSGTAQTARTAGQWGGEETNLLTTNEMPSHNHNGATGNAGSHSHTPPGGSLGTANIVGHNLAVSGGSQWSFTNSATITNTVADHSHSISSQGGGARHNNVPPFVVLNFIIKT